jgi:hypothetical protein
MSFCVVQKTADEIKNSYPTGTTWPIVAKIENSELGCADFDWATGKCA